MRILLTTILFVWSNTLFSQVWQNADSVATVGNEVIHAVTTDASGNVYVAGSWDGTDIPAFGVHFSGGTKRWYGGLDGFVAKYDPAGNVLWAFNIGSIGGDDEIKDITIGRTSQRLYITGYFTNTADFTGTEDSPDTEVSEGGRDIFVAKYDLAGELLWVKQGGGGGDDEGLGIDQNGAVYVTGYYTDSLEFDNFPSNVNADADVDYFLAKFLNSDGNDLWVRDGGSVSSPTYPQRSDIGYDVVADGTNVYVVGTFNTPTFSFRSPGNATLQSHINPAGGGGAGKPDIFMAQYGTNGSLGWTQRIGGASGQIDNAYAMTTDGTYLYITGSTQSNCVFPTGRVEGGQDAEDIFTAQINKSDGTENWVNYEISTQSAFVGDQEFSYDITYDGVGRVIVTGEMHGDMNFGGVDAYLGAAQPYGFAVAYCVDSTYAWSTVMSSTSFSSGYGVAVDTLNDRVYLVGEYNSTLSFDGLTLLNAGGQDGFLAYLDDTTTSCGISPPGPCTPVSITSCASNDTVVANASCQYTLVKDYRDSATVNATCGLDSIQQIPALGTVLNAGVNQIQLVAVDSSGNTDTCTFQVVVEIAVNPVVVNCGDEFIGESTLGDGDDLNNFTGCTAFPTTGEDRYYQITVPTGNYQIHVTMSNFVDGLNSRADIFWLGGNCPSTTNCLSQTQFRQSDQRFVATNNGTMTYFAAGPGTYYLVVDAQTSHINRYDIEFNCASSGIIFDTIAAACDARDLNNDGIVALVENDTSMVVERCIPQQFCHDIYIANEQGVEWVDSINYSLDTCYKNVTGFTPDGINNAKYNPSGGDWTAVYDLPTNNIAWSFSDASYANFGYGDGNVFSGDYSCDAGNGMNYEFCFTAEIQKNCPNSSNLPIVITARDDGISTTTTAPGIAVVISDDFILDPSLVNNVISKDTGICLGNPSDTIFGALPSGGAGGYTYLWQESPDSLNWQDAVGINTNIDYEPPILTYTHFYRRIVFNSCNDTSNIVKITILPAWPAWSCNDVCVKDLPIDLNNCIAGVTNGTADNVISNNNVTSANDILGVSDGNFAEFYEDLDDIYVDLTDTIPVGTRYFIRWRQRPGEVATSTFNIYESVDNVVYTLHSTGPTPTNIENFFTEAIIAENPTRFLRIERVGATMRDFDIDGISYAFSGTKPGTWTGPAITGSIFDPAVAGIGAHVVTYTAGVAGCTSDSTRTINVVNGPCWNFINDSTSTNNEEIGNDVAVDSINQVVYVVGLFEDTMSFPSISEANMNAGGGSGNNDGFLAKYDFIGNLIWVVNMGGTGYEEATGVTVGPSGDVYITGYFDGAANLYSSDLSVTPLAGAGNEDVFVAKYNAAGILQWANAAGGASDDRGHAISASAIGLYVTGLYEDAATFDGIATEATYNNQINTFLARYDFNTGVAQWLVEAKSDGNDNFSGATLQDGGMSVVAYDTNIYVMGYMAHDTLKFVDSSRSLVNAFQLGDPNNGADNLFIYSISERGNINWTQQIDNINSGAQFGTGIAADCDGIYISGSSHDGALFPGPDSLIPFDHDKAFLAQLSPFDGSEIWLQQWDGNADHLDVMHDVVADGFGNVYAVGTYRSSSLAHPGGTLGAADGQDLMIFKFHNDGTYQWGQKSIGTNDDFGYAIAASGKDFIFATGEYSDGFQLGKITATPTTNDRNLFLARLGTDGTFGTLTCCTTPPVGGTATVSPKQFCPGDTLSLVLTGYTGSIQWQVSYNSGGSWINIGSGTDNESFVPTADNPLFHAVLASVSCPSDISSMDSAFYDTTLPVIVCPANVIQGNDLGSCDAVVNGIAPTSASDNCPGINVTYDITGVTTANGLNDASGTTFNLGLSTVKYIIEDTVGLKDSCTFTVTITDTTLPVFTSCANDQTLFADAGCSDTLIDYRDSVTVTDNCGTPILTQNPSVGTSVSGVNTVWVIAEDASGNKDSCSFMVTVVDTTRPVINCIGNQTRYVDGSCDYSLDNFGVGATDNCQLQSVVQSPAAGTVFGKDTVTVTVTATDTSGNVSTCNFDVFVIDTIAPSITCPSNQNGTLDASCQFVLPYYGAGTATDNCGIDTIVQSPVQGSTITGTTTITLTAQDSSGNTSVCTFDVIITDVTAPVFTSCANDQTLYADAGCSDTLIDYRDSVTVTDNCVTPILTQNPAIGTLVSGVNTVWVIAEDGAGNKDSCSFTVTVVDTTSPVINCIGNQTRYVDGSCDYSLDNFGVGATDNCQLQSVVQSPAAGTVFGKDTVTVTVTATDTSGNVSTCNFDVIVLDTIAPNITCPANQNGTLDASCQFVLPYYGAGTATDNCGIDTIIQSPAQGTVITGTTAITLTAQDSSGNTSVCNFDVIITDATAPVFTSCVNNQILYAGASCSDTLIDYRDSVTVTDNCGTPILTQNPSVGTSVSGVNTVWVIAEDGAGNKDSCSFTVTVIDTIAPTMTCLGNQIRFVSASCNYSLEDFTSVVGAVDNCQLQSVNQTPAISTTLTAGTTTTITILAVDSSGNSSTCIFDLQVMDTISIICPSDTFSCDSILTYSLPDISDNCGAITLTQSDASGYTTGSAFPIGITIQEYTATDVFGNTNVCQFSVEIGSIADVGWTGLPNQVCENDSLIDLSTLLTTGNSGVWLGNGVIGNSFDPSSAGVGFHDLIYSVNSTCPNDSTLSIDVNAMIKSNAGLNDSICADTIYLQADSNNSTGVWRSLSPNIIIQNASDPQSLIRSTMYGAYNLVWKLDDNCAIEDTVNIIFYESPTIANAGEDQHIFTNSTQLNANLPSVGTGNWSLISGNGSIYDLTNPFSEITELNEGENLLEWTISNSICKASMDSVLIVVEDGLIPTGFSPNGDGINDVLTIVGISEMKENNVVIVNRWGQIVYSAENYQNDWDGRNDNGKIVLSDTYFLIIHSEGKLVSRTYLEIQY